MTVQSQSAPQIVRLLLVGSPGALQSGDIVSKIQFWISFYGSFEQFLVAANRSCGILHGSLETAVQPRIELLRQFGVRDIATLCSNNPKLLTFSLERVKEVLLRAEELGVPRNSRMFKYVVAAVACNSREKVAAKI